MLEKNLQNLTNLKQLDVSHNSITFLEPFLINLQLQLFNISNNPLKPQFQVLLEKSNQKQPELQDTFKQIFQDNLPEENNTKPKWFEQAPNKTFAGGFTSKPSTSFKQEEPTLQRATTDQGLNEPVFEKHSQPQSGKSELEIDYQELIINKTISQVYNGSFRGTPVAIKKIFDPNVTEELLDEFNNEIKMLSILRHPNIVLIMGICSVPPNLSIVTEYLPSGSLFQLLHQSKKDLNFNQKVKSLYQLRLGLQIAQSIHFLHKSQIIHRDIKSHNVLLDDNLKTKLCDFGLAKKYSDLNKGLRQFCGTPCYMAGELFQKKAYNYKIDIFAYGTLLWEIFAREIPYDGQEPQDISKKVTKNEPLAKVDFQINQIVLNCRDPNPENRPDLDFVIDQLFSLQKS